jgi:tetratricopeptide (TPR) repeat protein
MPPVPQNPPPAARPEPPRQPQVEEREDEKARLIRLGREAMAAAEYGRAADRFRQAGAVAPGEALPKLLLAQALLALGKYRDAVDSLSAGLTLEPNWSASAFRPLELYGPNVVDYSDHLRRLEETLARHPDDPVLLFLTAYALWFDGRKDEARLLFRRALPGAPDPAVIERFLGAMPVGPVL